MGQKKQMAWINALDVEDGVRDQNGAATADFPFKQTMPYLAQVLARLLQSDYMSRIAGSGIAPAQAFVLGELWLAEPLSQVELARRLDIGKATVGQTLGRLERSGLIERRRLDSDRRVIMIHLTDEGRALRKPLEIASYEQIELLTDRIGIDEFEKLTALLHRATALLRRPSPVPD